MKNNMYEYIESKWRLSGTLLRFTSQFMHLSLHFHFDEVKLRVSLPYIMQFRAHEARLTLYFKSRAHWIS